MSNVIFFTKPGCQTGIKQIEVLQEAGHYVNVQSILDHPWTLDELLSYFGDLPVNKWFNPNSPRVKSGEVDPGSFDKASATTAMMQDHLLIRRPLLQVGDRRKCGFDIDEINEWIGVSSEYLDRKNELQTCSVNSGNSSL